MLRPCLLLLLAMGCGSRATTGTPAATPAREDHCGNGIVDRGELCDPNVKWAERCPEPWGMCWKCSAACNAKIASVSEAAQSALAVPFCEERHPNAGTTVQTYDDFGRMQSRLQSSPSRQNATILEYDVRGRIVMHESEYRADGNVNHSRLHNVYEGDLRVRAWEDYDLDGKPDRTWHYTHSEDGRMLREMSTESDGRFSYDSDGNLIGYVTTFPDTEWTSWTQFTYDERGRQIREVSGSTKIRAEPGIDCRTTYHANGSRRCCKIRGEGGNSDPCFERDRFGEITVLTNVTVGRNTNNYDSRGLLTKQVQHVDGEVAFEDRRTYDELGNETVREIESNNYVTRIEHGYACLANVYPRMPMRAYSERR